MDRVAFLQDSILYIEFERGHSKDRNWKVLIVGIYAPVQSSLPSSTFSAFLFHPIDAIGSASGVVPLDLRIRRILFPVAVAC